MTRLTLAAFALAIASPTLADTDETPVPPVAWDQDFLGTYAVDGACEDPDQVWILTEFQVDMGNVRCTGIGKMTFGDNGLEVPMSECRRGVVDMDNRRISFAREDGSEALTAMMDGETLALSPCAGATPVQ